MTRGRFTDVEARGGKPLWNSENEATYLGVRVLARALNRAYVETNATAHVEWPLANGVAAHLPFMGNILPAVANEPWSGHYHLSTALWAMAHHAQFAARGWRYDRAASLLLAGGGSAVTRRSGADFSVVLETVACEARSGFPRSPFPVAARHAAYWPGGGRGVAGRAAVRLRREG